MWTEDIFFGPSKVFACQGLKSWRLSQKRKKKAAALTCLSRCCFFFCSVLRLSLCLNTFLFFTQVIFFCTVLPNCVGQHDRRKRSMTQSINEYLRPVIFFPFSNLRQVLFVVFTVFFFFFTSRIYVVPVRSLLLPL